MMFFSGGIWADDGKVEDVRLGLTPGKTRIVLDLSAPAKQYRVVEKEGVALLLELPGFKLAGPINPLPLSGTPIVQIISQNQDDHSLMLALELDQAVTVETFRLGPFQSRGHRLVIDLLTGQQTRHSEPAEMAADVSSEAEAEANAAAVANGVKQDATSSSSATHRSKKGYHLQFDGTWEQEWAVETDGTDSQKFESLIEPRFDIRLPNQSRLTSIARIRLDTVGDLGPDDHKTENYSTINGPWYNNAHAEFSLRELYIDFDWGRSDWRIGKQQVVWGEADGIKVLDVVNPQSFREFILDDFDDSRIPLTMVNVEYALGGEFSVQGLLIPDTSYHELAEFDSPFFMTTRYLVPVPPQGVAVNVLGPDKPDDFLDDGDIGGRLSGFAGGWDFTLNYLYHYHDYPVYYQQFEARPEGDLATVNPEYERNHLVGGTASSAFGDITIRAELAFNSDTYQLSRDLSSQGIDESAELASVIGLDWHLGVSDTLLSVQWFQSHLFDHEPTIIRSENEHNASLYFRRDFANETWRLTSLALYSIDHEDSMVQLKLSHLWRSNIDLWIGADIFSGDRDGVYGQFSDRDRILLGMKLGF